MFRSLPSACLVLLCCISVGCNTDTPAEVPAKADTGAVQRGIQESKDRREKMGAEDTTNVDADEQAAETTGG